MKILEFIFKLLWQFINFAPGRFTELQDKAALWQTQQMEVPPEKQKWYHKLFKYDNEWWFQIAAAIVFLFAFKAVRAWLMTDPADPGNEDDEDADDDGEDDLEKVKPAAFGGFKL